MLDLRLRIPGRNAALVFAFALAGLPSSVLLLRSIPLDCRGLGGEYCVPSALHKSTHDAFDSVSEDEGSVALVRDSKRSGAPLERCASAELSRASGGRVREGAAAEKGDSAAPSPCVALWCSSFGVGEVVEGEDGGPGMRRRVTDAICLASVIRASLGSSTQPATRKAQVA